MAKIDYVDLATMGYRGQGVAWIYFVNRHDRTIQIPNGFTLWDTVRNANVRPRMIHGYDAFFINWTNSYTLFQNGVEVLALRNQMQQTLEGVDWFEYDVEMGP
ncbi:hypothetical protein C2G38_2151646 [Gigaspora rosea]|uniref:Uncharacterized protein n=1 Tax=Gigaspora rosea TaxID=44941 RepID=A0A397W9E4_9GLOM|nr:hypothetical protein C2G38_2151646 [Gigaspora rosea]